MAETLGMEMIFVQTFILRQLPNICKQKAVCINEYDLMKYNPCRLYEVKMCNAFCFYCE